MRRRPRPEPARTLGRWLGLVAIVIIAGACTSATRSTPTPQVAPSVAAPSAASAPPRVTTSSTPRPSPAATMPPMDAVFESPWYGYSVAYPNGWQTTPGDGPWPLNTNLRHDDPHLDVIIGPVGSREARFVAASQALPAGTTIDTFRSWASPGGCAPRDPIPTPLIVGGAEALISLNGCHSLAELGGLIYDVEVVSGGRGYDFTIDGPIDSAQAASWLATIKLGPASAPSGSSSPSPK